MERAINGHPTWVEDRGGDGPPVLLLHGGLSESGTMAGIGDALAPEGYRVIAFDRRGHGRTRDNDAPFHYADMATEAIAVLDDVVGGPAHLVGWSDGGIVSMLVALERPDMVTSLVLIGANYHYDGTAPVEFDPDSPVLAMIAEGYGAVSPDGPDHFAVFAEKTATMWAGEPTLTVDDVARLGHPTLVLVGDDDLPTLAHTTSLFEALPNGQLAVVPAASHMVPLERPEIVATLIREFLASGGAVETLMPVRRAATGPA